MTRSLVAVALFAAGCGYAFTAGRSRLPAGAERVAVRPFENHSADPEAGGFVAAALREELSRRDADAPGAADARIEGEVVGSGFVPSSPNNATYVVTLEVTARLVIGSEVRAEQRVRRDEEYVGAIDSLESEGRRRLALRRAAAGIARDLMERFEAP